MLILTLPKSVEYPTSTYCDPTEVLTFDAETLIGLAHPMWACVESPITGCFSL